MRSAGADAVCASKIAFLATTPAANNSFIISFRTGASPLVHYWWEARIRPGGCGCGCRLQKFSFSGFALFFPFKFQYCSFHFDISFILFSRYLCQMRNTRRIQPISPVAKICRLFIITAFSMYSLSLPSLVLYLCRLDIHKIDTQND